MTEKQVRLIQNGLYRIFWKEGGVSLAAIGRNYSGKVWYCPVNWINGKGWYDWTKIKTVELLVEKSGQKLTETIERQRRRNEIPRPTDGT